jgi:hypothetical protein
VCLT